MFVLGEIFGEYFLRSQLSFKPIFEGFYTFLALVTLVHGF